MSTLIAIVALFICVVTPVLLTIFNIINLFKKKKIKENFIDSVTFILGMLLTAVWYVFQDFKDYQESLRLGGLEIEVHSPISFMEYANIYRNICFRTSILYFDTKKKIKFASIGSCNSDVWNGNLFNIYGNVYYSNKQKFKYYRNTFFYDISNKLYIM